MNQIDLINVVIGFGAGMFLAAIFMIAWIRASNRNRALERQNAELISELKNEKAALDRAGAQLDLRFKATAQEALNQSAEQFLRLAQEKLAAANKDSAHDLEKRQRAIDELMKPVQKNLEAMAGALEQVKGTDQALRDDVRNLHKETARLTGALRNPAYRGAWGEAMLERLLENSGLMKDVHYQMQVTLQGEDGKLRPDAIIKLPDSLHVVIDAKAPIAEFARDMNADMDEAGYKNLQNGLAAAVRGHIIELSRRAYWEQLQSPDFVVLFLPSEHLFSAAVQADPSLLDLAAKSKIVMASPILIMSLLRVVAMGWRQAELAKNVQAIEANGHELYKRLRSFAAHIEKIGKNIQQAMKGYDDAVGSLQTSVLPAARKFRDLQPGISEDLPEIESIERVPRLLALSAEDQDDPAPAIKRA
jgi:DNA recombination protein RmuC